MGDRPLIVVLGPTGSGKSELALRIAETFSGEIVNADSVQLYRGFDIGSAKLPLGARRGIPHHLIDILSHWAVCTAGEYASMARAAIGEISARNRLPILAGGTGFYVRALLDGLFPGPSRDQDLRADLSRRDVRRSGFLHRALRRFDPAAALRIHPHDRNKLMRALEVCLLTRRPITEAFAAGRDPLKGYIPLKTLLDPPRSGLYWKLDERCAAIFSGGLVEEVRSLLAQGVQPEAKPFESIGYKQALRVARGELSPDDALAEMRRDTRRYAKRQMTWWRRESSLTRVSGFGTDETVVRSILNTVSQYLLTFNRSE
jgi:tRNA dimethylallyltransferase